MAGHADSLNVSAAAAIALYELVRRQLPTPIAPPADTPAPHP
jgi:hypothetical protein